LASSLVFIDGTALNVALPAIQEDLGISGTELYFCPLYCWWEALWVISMEGIKCF
jgi:hypothetical protein